MMQGMLNSFWNIWVTSDLFFNVQRNTPTKQSQTFAFLLSRKFHTHNEMNSQVLRTSKMCSWFQTFALFWMFWAISLASEFRHRGNHPKERIQHPKCVLDFKLSPCSECFGRFPWHLNSDAGGITQKKEYNIQNAIWFSGTIRLYHIYPNIRWPCMGDNPPFTT